MKGSKGKLPKKQLVKKAGSTHKKKVPFKFTKGSTHIFKITGPEIGELKSINIEVMVINVWNLILN